MAYTPKVYYEYLGDPADIDERYVTAVNPAFLNF